MHIITYYAPKHTHIYIYNIIYYILFLYIIFIYIVYIMYYILFYIYIYYTYIYRITRLPVSNSEIDGSSHGD